MTTPYCMKCGVGFEKVDDDYWECPVCGDQRPIVRVTVHSTPKLNGCEACQGVLQLLGKKATTRNSKKLREAKKYARDPRNHDPDCSLKDVPEKYYPWNDARGH